MEHLKTIERLVRRVRLRLKLQAALQALYVASIPAALVGVLGVLLFKLRLYGAETLDLIAVVACGLLAAGALIGLARRVRDVDAAQRLDRAGGLKDRLGSALAFARAPASERTPLMEAAITDAGRVVGGAHPRSAVPIEVPVRLAGVTVVATAIIAALLLVVDFPIDQDDGAALARIEAQPLPQRKRATLRTEDKKRLKKEAEELAKELAATEDPAIKRWIEKLNQLIRDLQEGKLTAKEAYAKMADLEKARQKWDKEVGDGLEAAKKQLEKAADKTLRPSKKLESMVKALKERDLDKAAKELDKLAKTVEQGKLKAPDRRALGKDLKKLAEALKTERAKREEDAQSKHDKLRQKRRRLKQKKPKADLSQQDKRRLDKLERQLEKLRRERQEMSQARRQLERLQRQMSKAAEDLMRRMQQQNQAGGQQQQMTAQQMKDAAEMLRRLDEAAKSGKTFRMAEGKMIDMKEMLRRAGQGKDGKDGKDGKGSKLDKFTLLAKGKKGEGGKDGKDGKDGKGGKPGQDGKPSDTFELGKAGEGKKGGMMMLGGEGDGPQLGPSGPPTAKAPGAGNTEGEGAGDGHDSNMMGAKTRLAGAKHKEDFVAGEQGAGASQSRVVFAAAKKGFATRAYKQVHQDYSGVVEETLDRQHIPAGSRRYVRRYFDLIRPR